MRSPPLARWLAILASIACVFRGSVARADRPAPREPPAPASAAAPSPPPTLLRAPPQLVVRPDEAAPLRVAAHEWFDGERQSGYLWGGAGLASLAAAGALWRGGKGSEIERGMAYPMGAFGLIQAIIGAGSLLRSSARADTFDASLAQSPEKTRQQEVARMQTLNGFFLAIEIVEVAVVVGGAALAATRRGEGQELARGVGLGLAVEGGAMLFLDSMAAARAHGYAGQLGQLSYSARLGPGGASIVGSF